MEGTTLSGDVQFAGDQMSAKAPMRLDSEDYHRLSGVGLDGVINGGSCASRHRSRAHAGNRRPGPDHLGRQWNGAGLGPDARGLSPEGRRLMPDRL